jgi:hypothetical protein
MESEEYREDSSPTEKSESQAETVEVLRKTIRRLEEIANRLETESPKNLPSRYRFENLLTTTEKLAAQIDGTETDAIGSVSVEKIDKPSSSKNASIGSDSEETVSFSWIDRILNSIRLILPSSVSNALSDWALIGIASTILVVLSLTSVWLLPEQTTDINQETQPPTIITTPEPLISEKEVPEVEIPETETQAPEAEISIPPELKAPKAPEVVENLPPPQPILTPEQSLVASIQEQIANITDRYSEDLITSIEANFRQSFLLVKLSDNWYALDKNKQNKIGNEILENSKSLDFSKLEVVDREGTLIARNPIVGKDIIILQRTKDLLSSG